MSGVVACTRVSTLAKSLDDKGGLLGFTAATTLESVAKHPDLRSRLAVIDPAEGWRGYAELHEEAQRRRGKPEAESGTNVHQAVEALIAGRLLPEELLGDARAVLAALAELGLEPEGSEEFVYVPGLPEHVAGTRDLLCRTAAGTRVVVDIKTAGALGSHRFRATAWALQVACYSRGRPYLDDFARDQWGRPRLDPTRAGRRPARIDQRRGYVVEVARGLGDVAVHELDLEEGWRLAQLACQVRAARKAVPIVA